MQYNDFVHSHNKILVAGVLLALLAAVVGPVVLRGYTDLQAARSALAEGRDPEAGQLFESAARKLTWRNELWEQAGLAAYHGGDIDGALRLLEIARQKRALSAEGWNTLGAVFWTRQEATKAIAIWKAGILAFPRSTQLYDQLIMAYHSQDDFAAEQEALTKRLAIAEDAAAHYQLGLVLALSDAQGAQQQFSAAASLNAQFKPAADTLIFALKAAGNETDPARRLVIIGRGLGLVEEWGAATAAFEKAVSLDGTNAEAWAWLGEARQHQGQDGSHELDQALALGPQDPVVHALRGLYWRRQGNYPNALAEDQQAAQIDPANPAWQVSVGEAYTLNGDLVSALSAYQKGTSLAPNDASYWRLLAMFCADNNVQVLEIGLPAAQKAAELAPADAQALDALGYSYLRAGYLYNAEQNLLKAVKAAPESAEPHLHLAETYLQKGDSTSAFHQLDLARQLDPSGPTGQFADQLIKEYYP